MKLHLPRRRFTVAEYYQMAQAGILGEDDRVELIEGEVVEMPPIGDRYAGCVNRLNERFVRTFADVALVAVRNPVRLDEQSEPQPVWRSCVAALTSMPPAIRLRPTSSCSSRSPTPRPNSTGG